MTSDPATHAKPRNIDLSPGVPEATRARNSLRRVVREAILVLILAITVGVLSNIVRRHGKIAWVKDKPYDVLVPCPEPVGQAQAIKPNDPIILDSASLVLDARTARDFADWHVPHAISAPFDWLGPPMREEVDRVAQMVAHSSAKRVVIYGDGDDPDSGTEWARLLSGGGIRNVFFVEGGAPALKLAIASPGGRAR